MYHIKNNDKKGIDYTFTFVPSKPLNSDNSRVRFRVIERSRMKKIIFGETEACLSDVLINNNPIRAKVKNDRDEVGILRLKEMKRPPRFTFLNYVDAGAEISLMIAMDFTKSNKEPTDPMSLHYCMNGIGSFFNENLMKF